MKKYKIKYILLASIAALFATGCKKFLDIGTPKDSIDQKAIFKNDEIATSAITGIYSTMAKQYYASGNQTSISINCGSLADEYIGYTSIQVFFENEVPPANATIASGLWGAMYKSIYSANSILEGIRVENQISPPVSSQLQGEALFVRAFANFYLVNLFGPVPVILTSDYRLNSVASRASVNDVYHQIIEDLKEAEQLLGEEYITTERIRPNKSAVQALLARVYLYTEDWENAEKYSTAIINKTGVYKLVGYDDIFLKNSMEAIWQLMPAVGGNTNDGAILNLTGTPTYVSLQESLVSTFDNADKRKVAWVRSFTNSSGTYYYPNKYKIRQSATVTEYSMVMRLAEQYLIRAEARAHLNKTSQAIDDLDMLRNRAGLSLIKNTNPSISQANLLEAIINERRLELFSEWGHRWLDLKRTGKAHTVLSAIKRRWQETDILLPIPQSDIDKNIKLTQNPGY